MIAKLVDVRFVPEHWNRVAQATIPERYEAHVRFKDRGTWVCCRVAGETEGEAIANALEEFPILELPNRFQNI